MSAVAGAGDHDSAGVEVVARLDPIEKAADIFISVFTLETIVERGERLAESKRAAHVGLQIRHSQFIADVVFSGTQPGARLAFRAAMNVDDDRPLSVELRRGLIKPTGESPTIERFP